MCRQHKLPPAAERISCCIMFLRKLSLQQRKLLNVALTQNYCDAVFGSVNHFENKLVREFQCNV